MTNIIGHVIHDGWEIRFRETKDQKIQVRIIEPYLESIRTFLASHQDAKILSLVFWAKRFPLVDSPGIYQDLSRFFEKTFTPDEIATLPDNWLVTTRQEVMRFDNEQIAQLTAKSGS